MAARSPEEERLGFGDGEGVKGHKVFLAIAQQPGHPRKKQKPFAGKCQAPRCQCLMKTFAITMIIL